MSQVLGQFAEPRLDRVPDRNDPRAVKALLRAAAHVWNEAILGAKADAAAREEVREVCAALFGRFGWSGDPEKEAQELRERRAALFPRERRLVLRVDVEQEEKGLRVYALGAIA